MFRKKKLIISAVIILAGIFVLFQQTQVKPNTTDVKPTPTGKILSGQFDENKFKPNSEWKKILTPKQYYILREAGTEIPFTGTLNNEKRAGTYYSVGCNQPVFRSEHKYDSGTGWPSFWEPIKKDAVVLRIEQGFSDTRVEVLDPCGGHLGHVFDDGPPPTGKRYCMNSEALKFVPDKEQ